SCTGKACGDDGCGGSCGACPGPQDLCVEGLCTCLPSCAGKACGDDGCGGSCGACPGPQDLCVEGLCTCQPSCAGKACGDDGCGGSCGQCTPPETCSAQGSCTCDCTGVPPEPVCATLTDTTYLSPCEAICAGVESYIPGPCSMECVIEPGPAIAVGDPCPPFACPDLNPGSSTFGQEITPVFLGELIWIAYFGSCT
ncbi:MAG: hypothetical protein FJ098_07650, partial [Deltaproteobacteria bacterium]|nr:hypothetical protein [Deltaproteobacteria bacterium]